VKRINNALLSADQINKTDSENNVDWLVPIIADAEAGFGGNLNAFELMKLMIEAGASAVHFEDQLSSAKKCGHMGGKVLVPTQEAISKLVSARLASDVLGTDTLIIARTDADSANLITSNIDDRDKPFIIGERSSEGFYRVKAGIDQAINRGLSYAPYADLIWCETSKPNIEEARKFAKAIHAVYPGKLLAYNCSPSFNWQANLSKEEMRSFREELNNLGFKFQFITLAGFHVLNTSMFELAKKIC
jgi:isocitrate lyase